MKRDYLKKLDQKMSSLVEKLDKTENNKNSNRQNFNQLTHGL